MRLFGGLGRRFGWLWAAYAVSASGTWLGFGAFSFIAITVLHASAAEDGRDQSEVATAHGVSWPTAQRRWPMASGARRA